MYGARIVVNDCVNWSSRLGQAVLINSIVSCLSTESMKRKATARTSKKEAAKPLPKAPPASSVPIPPPGTRLTAEFYDQECGELAQALLGKVLVRKLPDGQVLKGTIVETEAYPGGVDRASQSFGGRRTERNEPMYMTPGTTYVYFTYGMYHCFNISSKGDGSAVLLRGLEPKEEYEIMHQLRNGKGKLKSKSSKNDDNSNKVEAEATDEPPKKKLKHHELGNGPSKLCMALDITRFNCNKLDIATSDELWLETNDDLKYYDGDFTIDVGKRIGIDSTPPEARNKLWRYFISDNFSVSKVSISEIKKRLAAAEQEKDQQNS